MDAQNDKTINQSNNKSECQRNKEIIQKLAEFNPFCRYQRINQILEKKQKGEKADKDRQYIIVLQYLLHSFLYKGKKKEVTGTIKNCELKKTANEIKKSNVLIPYDI